MTPSGARVTVHFDSDIVQIAETLLLVAPTPDFAAGVVALANALGAATPQMAHIIGQRWQFWAAVPAVVQS